MKYKRTLKSVYFLPLISALNLKKDQTTEESDVSDLFKKLLCEFNFTCDKIPESFRGIPDNITKNTFVRQKKEKYLVQGFIYMAFQLLGEDNIACRPYPDGFFSF